MSALLSIIERISLDHTEAVARPVRREIGQFFTPPSVAAFMASMLDPRIGPVRILDPGAGTGILGIAAAEHLLKRGAASVHLVAIERDRLVSARLGAALETSRDVLGDPFTFEVRTDDFLDYGQLLRLPEHFDVIVANPPYQKMRPDDPRGGGSPNAYTRFMQVSAEMLTPDGVLCFIVPRSYASGLYFRRFRKQFHRTVHLRRAHVFGSRRDAFRSDAVLQESVIVLAGPRPVSRVLVSTSGGIGDLDQLTALSLTPGRVLDVTTPEAWLYLPESSADLAAVELVEGLPSSMRALGLSISTGPVVPFRAREWLRPIDQPGYPLLWMNHVRRGDVQWPKAGLRKPQRVAFDAPPSLLMPVKNYVLLRRFSAKGDAARLVAAALERGHVEGDFVGIENHLNVIYSSGEDISIGMTHGLARLLNSDTYESYFRVLNGNTQVSATEIRATRFPQRELVEIAGSVGDSIEELLVRGLRATA